MRHNINHPPRTDIGEGVFGAGRRQVCEGFWIEGVQEAPSPWGRVDGVLEMVQYTILASNGRSPERNTIKPLGLGLGAT